MFFKRVSTSSSRAAATGIGAAVVLHGVFLWSARLLPAPRLDPRNMRGQGGILEIETRPRTAPATPRARLAAKSRPQPAPQSHFAPQSHLMKSPPLQSPRRAAPSTRFQAVPRLARGKAMRPPAFSRATVSRPEKHALPQKPPRQKPPRLASTEKLLIDKSTINKSPRQLPFRRANAASARRPRVDVPAASSTASRIVSAAHSPGQAARFGASESARRARWSKSAPSLRGAPRFLHRARSAAVASQQADELAGEASSKWSPLRHSAAASRRQPRFASRADFNSPGGDLLISPDAAPASTPSNDDSARRRLSHAQMAPDFRSSIRRAKRRLSGNFSMKRTRPTTPDANTAPNANTAPSLGANATNGNARDRKTSGNRPMQRAYRQARAFPDNPFAATSASANGVAGSVGQSQARDSGGSSEQERRALRDTSDAASSSGSKGFAASQNTASNFPVDDVASGDAASGRSERVAATQMDASRGAWSRGVSRAQSQAEEEKGRATSAEPKGGALASDEQSGDEQLRSSARRGQRNRTQRPSNGEAGENEADGGEAGGREAATRESPLAARVFVKARFTSKPSPDYPAEAKRLGQEGVVLLRLKISATGAIKSVVVARSSGHALLDEAALRAAGDWRAVPARRGATAIESSLSVPIRFKLD